MKQKINLRFTVLFLLIVLAAFSQVIPHMPNFSPLGAIGLFGAAYFTKKWQAFLLPISATWLSDLFINNAIYAKYYPEFTWFYNGFYWQYASYLLITLVGLFILKSINTKRILSGALISSIIFFVVSNFGVWANGALYPQTMEGLIACFAAGIPFAKGTVLGDLFYSGVLFGAFSFSLRTFPALRIKEKLV